MNGHLVLRPEVGGPPPKKMWDTRAAAFLLLKLECMVMCGCLKLQHKARRKKKKKQIQCSMNRFWWGWCLPWEQFAKREPFFIFILYYSSPSQLPPAHPKWPLVGGCDNIKMKNHHRRAVNLESVQRERARRPTWQTGWKICSEINVGHRRLMRFQQVVNTRLCFAGH